MAEETKFNQDKYVVLQDKSKEEILSDKELTKLYIDFLEYQISLVKQIIEKDKIIREQSEKAISLLEENIEQKERIIQKQEEESKLYRKLLRMNGISIPFQN